MPAIRKTKAKKATAAAAGNAKKASVPGSAGGKKARATKPVTVTETRPPPKQTSITITAAKGRPMLSWVGKRPLRCVTAFPAQHIENFNPAAEPPGKGSLLFHGDNKEVLANLLANGFRGKVNLIQIDPPFDSGVDYIRKVALRGAKGSVKIEGETYSLGEQIQYTDIWANDNYLQFMFERLMLLKELLHDQRGFIALQCDWRKAHHLRALLDEVFGSVNFRGEILIRAGTKNVQSQFDEVSALTTGNNSILLYSKSRDTKLPKLLSVAPDYEPGKWDTFWRGTDRHTMRYELLGVTPKDGQWRWEQKRAQTAVRNYEEYYQTASQAVLLDDYYVSKLEAGGVDLDFVRKDESGTVQYFVPPRNYKLLSNVWFDLGYRGSKTGYPTEKSEEPTQRLVMWLTQPNDVILDCFLGSGTTVAVAQRLGRRWIGCDINKGAIQTTVKRLEDIITEQIKAAKQAGRQKELIADDTEKLISPAQLSFAVHRVNDYDLAIQHNEAVNLACEHIGITRTRSDSFFDGSVGQRLAKIIPFGHPLSVPDLEDLKKELSARPNEGRDVVVVCLGKELTVDSWLGDWNRLRKRGDVPNKIEVIELRTDPKYGKFIAHQPARAKVDIVRKADKLVVEIKDFISPSIIERLQTQAGLLQPKIDDWRAMVDCVMIDPAHDGEVFNIALADVPEKKTDYVHGRYELPAPEGKTMVAVKITDMLGEEVLVTKEVG